MAILSKPGLKEYYPEGIGRKRNFPIINPYLKNVEQVSNLFQEFIENKSISKPNQLGFIVNLSEIQKDGWTVTDKIPEIKLFDFPDKHEILDCVEIIRGTSIPFKTSSTGEEFNFIKISDFNNNLLDLGKTKKIFLDKNEISKIKRFLIKKDDILFSCRCTIGKKLLIKNELKNCIASSNLMILRPESSLIHPEYLQYVLDKEIVKDQISALSGGIAIPMLTLTKFSKIIIPVPSLFKQKQIASKALKSLEEISKIEKLLEETKRKYQEL
jgi:restriction endonuclease S subunit